MKIGFSSLVCPGWDLATIVDQAATLGFDGVELRGLRGELHLPLVSELAADPTAVSRMFSERNIELVCLGTSTALDSKNGDDIVRQKGRLTEFIELASQLACPYVKFFVGEVQRRDNLRATLARVAEHLISLVPTASRLGVTLLVENGGDFPGSQDLWFLIDAVGHPAVKCCWNQCQAKTVGERPTISLPRLGNKIGLIHLCDADFDDQGVLLGYKPLGEGQVEVAKQIELLKGLVYDRYLVFEWPKLWIDALPSPESTLPSAAQFLRDRINEKQPVLTAYKADKNAPRLKSRPASAGSQ